MVNVLLLLLLAYSVKIVLQMQRMYRAWRYGVVGPSTTSTVLEWAVCGTVPHGYSHRVPR